MKRQRVDRAGDRRADFEPRGSGFEAVRDWRARCRRPGAPARVARRACLPAARAGRLRLRAGRLRRQSAAADLAVRLGLADQAARHEAEQAIPLAHGIVALRAGRVAARGGGANGGVARAVLEFLDARLGFGELRARGVELGGGQRAILHDDDVAGLHRRAFGERQRRRWIRWRPRPARRDRARACRAACFRRGARRRQSSAAPDKTRRGARSFMPRTRSAWTGRPPARVW